MIIFAIIVTYNGRRVPYWYDNCFTSLRESTIPIQIIVVNNASSDDSVAYIREHFPEVILIESDKNLGFGQANNLGLRYARAHDADYVFLLNQDAWVDNNAIETLVSIAERHTDYGVLSPMHLHVSGQRLEKTIGMLIHKCYPASNDLLNDLYFNRLKDVYPLRYLNAAAWLLPRQTLDIIGGFDPIFFHYFEDDNYLDRVNYHGLKIGICPKCTMVHDEETQKKDDDSIVWRKKMLISEMCDINKEAPYDNFMKINMRYMLRKYLIGDWKRACEVRNEIRFLRSKAEAIVKSRTQNMKKAPSWL